MAHRVTGDSKLDSQATKKDRIASLERTQVQLLSLVEQLVRCMAELLVLVRRP